MKTKIITIAEYTKLDKIKNPERRDKACQKLKERMVANYHKLESEGADKSTLAGQSLALRFVCDMESVKFQPLIMVKVL